MFIDEFTHTVDAKGRVSVPSDMRDVLRGEYEDEKLVVTRSPSERCLWAFPVREWRKLARRLAKKGVSARRLHGMGTRCQLDSHGRINLEKHREWAGIGRDCVFVGVGSHMEIWAAESWLDASERMEGDTGPVITGVVAGLLWDEDEEP